MLHLIFQTTDLEAILNRIDDGDAVVFFGQMLLKGRKGAEFDQTLPVFASTRHLCVLNDDLKLFGIAEDELVEGIDIIDYETLVDLTIKHTQSLSWL
ncbi:MAG: hypothetical protein Kow0065_17010 [Methylomicrobium sp.]